MDHPTNHEPQLPEGRTAEHLVEIADLTDERSALVRDLWVARLMYAGIPAWLLWTFRRVPTFGTNRSMWFAALVASVFIVGVGFWREGESRKSLRESGARLRLLKEGQSDP